MIDILYYKRTILNFPVTAKFTTYLLQLQYRLYIVHVALSSITVHKVLYFKSDKHSQETKSDIASVKRFDIS